MNDSYVAQLVGLAGVPVVSSLVSIFKPLLPNRDLHPPLALALALALNVGIAVARSTDILEAIGAGILTGLAASGLYEISLHYKRSGDAPSA